MHPYRTLPGWGEALRVLLWCVCMVFGYRLGDIAANDRIRFFQTIAAPQ